MRQRRVASLVSLGGALMLAVVLCGTRDVHAAMNMDEFRSAVMGLDAQGVVQKVGNPDSKIHVDGEAWYYQDKVLDSATGKTFTAQVVCSKEGKVVSVNFF